MREEKKHSHLRKRVQMQRCVNLLSTNKYVLFFHYNGRRACNWQEIKDQLWERAVCKSLLVQSKWNLHSRFLKGIVKAADRCTPGKTPIGGGVFSAGDGPLRELAHLHHPVGNLPNSADGSGVDMPKNPPSGHSTGMLFQGPTLMVACSSLEQFDVVVKKCVPPHFICIGGVYQEKLLTHLDIQRCMQLQGNAERVYQALLQPLKQWHHFLYLLQMKMNWQFLRFHQNKMMALLQQCPDGAVKPPAGDLPRATIHPPNGG